MKKYIYLGILCLALNFNLAKAGGECAGETYTGTIVTINIETVGTMGFIKGATVRIKPKDSAQRSYNIERADIAQYFETVFDSNGNAEGKAFIGLSAFERAENPIFIRYSGKNHQEDLVKVLHTNGRKKEPNNEMIVWKGPGFSASEQHRFTDVVCNVSLDP